MEEFYIDVQLSRGITRLQVDEVTPEQWDMPYTPQFIIEFHNGVAFITLTLQLEQGKWYDRETRITAKGNPLFFGNAANALNLNYTSPLYQDDITAIGNAIARHMVVQLQAYLGLFTAAFPNPAFN